MRLFQKTACVFFGLIGIIGLFMPLVAYDFALVSSSFNIYDIIKGIATAEGGAGATLSALGEYGFKVKAIVLVVALVLGILCLLVGVALSVTDVKYPVQLAVTVVSFVGFVVAMAIFANFSKAVAGGVVPLKAIQGLLSGGDTGSKDIGQMLSGLVSGLIAEGSSTAKLSLGWGTYTCAVMTGIMIIINTLFTAFKAKIYELDGVTEQSLKADKQAKKDARKAKKASEETETEEVEVKVQPVEEPVAEAETTTPKKYQGVNPNTSKKKLKKQQKNQEK